MSDEHRRDEMEAPGVFVIALIFLTMFVVVWFMHLKWITALWGIG